MLEVFEPDFGRFLQVLGREGEPDRVPFVEFWIDYRAGEPLAGPPPQDPEASPAYRIKWMQALGFDYVMGVHTFGFPRSEYGLTAEDTSVEHPDEKRGWRDEHRGPIQSWQDFEQYPWPEVQDASFADFEKLERLLPEGMKVLPTLPGGVLENLVDFFGYEQLCFALIEQPDLVRAVVEAIGSRELELVETLADMDCVGALLLNDDLGFKTQTMISPADLRQYVFPWHARIVAAAHRAGKPCMLHACGNVSEVMEDIIGYGMDAKHSFEDVIQPVAEFKAQYGDRLAVLGGIDVNVLAAGTEEEVREYTRRVIEQCAPGGGWALGSGNSLPNYIPSRNYLAMLDEGKKHGVY
ncbi:MAG: uroporphyrinogen-III decarboxylase-like protein [candidate division WS1 bacterium]|nr:uroporphyrinogen-III decarboxylase-like protein [candidate division WS1 bacterium]